MRFQVSCRLEHKCVGCNFCTLFINCPGEENCTGCGACVEACPYSAKVLQTVIEQRRLVKLTINGRTFQVPERITVLRALELAGFKISSLAGEGEISAPCRTGGCWECAVVVDGQLRPSCITPVREGMVIDTDTAAFTSQRLVSGFEGHPVGGVGTPHWLKPKGYGFRYIEVACFAHGCILRCPTCQNWHITYSSVEEPLTPEQAARFMTRIRREYGVDRMAISGGEPTLNKRWLLNYLRQLRELNPDEKARLHVDTNGVVLTRDYLHTGHGRRHSEHAARRPLIDELVESGMTDIGIDVKGFELSTFIHITGVKEEALAQKLFLNEWSALKYLLDHYWGKVFIGVGIPYNSEFISLDEIRRIGERIASWEPDVQVCVLDYRGEFRARTLRRPTFQQMLEVKRTLEEAGLKCVICQTECGHIGP